jgi:hypothetical protein
MIPATNRVLKILSSLKLTVTLLALSIFLIFAGTWAQIDLGIWTVLKVYFRSFLVMIPFQIFLPRTWDVPGSVPWPGGFTLGGLLMINLLTAHAVRFKWQWKRAGILLVHFGIVLLIVGELVTALFADENNMTILEGQTVNYAEDIREIELAIVDRSDPANDHVVVVPQSMLASGKTIRDPLLPFEINVEHFYPNADLVDVSENASVQLIADRGVAADMHVMARQAEVASGVDRDRMDLPAAYLGIHSLDGQHLGTWLVSLYFSMIPEPLIQEVSAGGRTWHMTLRYKRAYKPYQMTLNDFRHDKYMGTETPMNYSSDVRLVDRVNNEDREVKIYMNNPLRYRGETFYQSSFKSGDTGTVLQVVRNPGWLLPYVACAIGALGLTVHFGTSLLRFLKRGRKS